MTPWSQFGLVAFTECAVIARNALRRRALDGHVVASDDIGWEQRERMLTMPVH
jgi:hypothetical protein